MKRTVCVFLMVFSFETQPLALCHAQAVDTDGDGLHDLIDVPGFNPDASGSVSFGSHGIEDFDGANLLTNLQTLELVDNQITNIESGGFAGLASLQELGLQSNQFTELNLTRATFENLQSCLPRFASGFCVDSGEITTLILDDATLSRDSFDVIVGETYRIADVSLVGLTFSDGIPADVDNLLRITTLDHVTVDRALFHLYADAFQV